MVASGPKPTNETAQHRYMEVTRKQISHAELQRLSNHLKDGDSIEKAVQKTASFFRMHELAREHARTYEPGVAAQEAYENFVLHYKGDSIG